MNPLLMIFALVISLFSCAEYVDTKEGPSGPGGSVGSGDYLALGDSYTIGQSVPESDRWPVLLVKLLREDSVRISDAKIIARTGWTTAELASAIAQSNDKKTYKMVSLLIGVNNQYRGQSVERYRTEFKELLVTSIAFAAGVPGRVVVLSIPDWGATPSGGSSDKGTISKEIDLFNLVAKEEALAAGVHFVDITPVSRTAINDPSLVASDGLHYSGKMHKLWAERVVPIARSLVK